MIEAEEKKLILIVDDASANLQIVRSILKEDFKIRVATSGRKGFGPGKRQTAAGPDLVGCDDA